MLAYKNSFYIARKHAGALHLQVLVPYVRRVHAFKLCKHACLPSIHVDINDASLQRQRPAHTRRR